MPDPAPSTLQQPCNVGTISSIFQRLRHKEVKILANSYKEDRICGLEQDTELKQAPTCSWDVNRAIPSVKALSGAAQKSYLPQWNVSVTTAASGGEQVLHRNLNHKCALTCHQISDLCCHQGLGNSNQDINLKHPQLAVPWGIWQKQTQMLFWGKCILN